MTKITKTKLAKKLMNKKEDVTQEVYVQSAEDYAIAKEVAILLAPKLDQATDGNYLIQLQALDILQDLIGFQAIQAKNKLKEEQANETNKGG
jgi:hypothetical protein